MFKSFMAIHNLIWVSYLLLFFVSPVKYPLSISTLILVFILLSLGNGAYFTGRYCGKQKYRVPRADNSYFNYQKFFKFLLVTSGVYFVLTGIKYMQLIASYGVNFSLYGLTQLRVLLENPSYIKGGNLIGVLASLFSGFPLLSIPFYTLFRHRFPANKQVALLLISFFYLGTTYLTGGRNGAMITLLIIAFSYLGVRQTFGKKRIVLSRSLKSIMAVLLVGVFFSFSKIFIDRAELTMGTLWDYITYFIESHFYELRPYARALLDNEWTYRYYFPIMFFHEYFVHSLNELDILLHTTFDNFPYWGGYEFHTFTLFLNKLGTGFISIEQITADLPRPGRYLTLFGGLYLDFGNIGLVLSVGFLYFFLGRSHRKFVRTRRLVPFLWFIYLYIIILLGPIYSLIGVSVYPGFLVAILIVSVLIKLGYFRPVNFSNHRTEKVALR